MQRRKRSFFLWHFRARVSSTKSKIRISERNAKKKMFFLSLGSPRRGIELSAQGSRPGYGNKPTIVRPERAKASESKNPDTNQLPQLHFRSSPTSLQKSVNFTSEVRKLHFRSFSSTQVKFLRFSIALFSNHLRNSENPAEDLPKSCRGFDEILLWILPNPHVDFRDASLSP